VAESRAVSPRVNQRAETAGVIAQMERRLDQFRIDLFHLNATVRLFAAELEPKPIPAKRIPALNMARPVSMVSDIGLKA
jgi:hypothetical protein